MPEKTYEIVSLGMNCLPRYILTIGGLKPRKAEGELTCPFDVCIHPIETIVSALENDFKGYYDDIYFKRYKRWFLDFRQKGYWEKPDGTVFVHDKDCKTIDELKDKLKLREQNLNLIINSDMPVVFVLYVRFPESRVYVNKLYDILNKKISNRKKFVLAVLDFNGIDLNLDYNKEIKVLNMEEPIPNFPNDWNRKRFVKSKFGKYIHRSVCSFVRNIIDEEILRGS
jgi:hypothetical protein